MEKPHKQSMREKRGLQKLQLPPLPTPSATEKNIIEIKESSLSLKDLTIIEKVGEGAFSVVFKVKMNSTGQILAMKRIKYFESQNNLKNVVNEIYCLNTLHHKNILPLYNVFCQEGAFHILMPLIDGLSLAEAIEVCPQVPERLLGRLTYLSVQGLQYIKKSKFLHRDLKPSNILLSKDGNVLISDFGTAKHINSSTDLIESFTGTLSYMSPERIKNESYTFKADVWSLGIIVYQCALGRFPMKQDRQIEYWDIFSFVENKIDVELQPTYSDGLKDFITCSLRHDQELRSDIEELMVHPWLKQFESKSLDAELTAWINDCYKKYVALKGKMLGEERMKKQAKK